MKLRIYILFTSLVIIGGGVVFLGLFFWPKQQFKPEPWGQMYPERALFLSAIKQATTTSKNGVSGLIVPHHLLASDLIGRAFKIAKGNSYDRVVIICTDHYNLGSTDISESERDFYTVFGVINTDEKVVTKLEKNPMISAGDFFFREHGIQAILPFVRYYFPDTPVVVLTIKNGTKQAELDGLIESLKKNISEKTLVIQSTDFSHYLTANNAQVRDEESTKVMRENNIQSALALIQPDNIDSSAALYVQMRLQAEFFKSAINFLDHKNSQDYTGEFVSSTTSYITSYYKK